MDAILSPLLRTVAPVRRLRKHALYRKRRLAPRIVRADPAAGNPIHADVCAYLEYWRTMGYREAGVLLRRKALRRFVAWADGQGFRSVLQLTCLLYTSPSPRDS